MNTIRITTTQNIDVEYDLASLGDRILARLVDGLVIAAYIIVIVMFFSFASMLRNFGDNAWLIFLFVLPVFFYDLASEILLNGQSVGKKVMKIKIISLDGGQPQLSQYIIRWLFRLVDFTFTSSLCALICVAVSERKQRVGDMVANTTLIKTEPRSHFQQTIYTPTPEVNYTVSFPAVANLTDKDMQLIKDVIINVNTNGNTMLAYHAAEKIKQTLQVQTNLEPLYFLQVLLADYNHITSKL